MSQMGIYYIYSRYIRLYFRCQLERTCPKCSAPATDSALALTLAALLTSVLSCPLNLL